MNRQYDVMMAGHLCLDIIPLFPDTGARRIDEILRPGKLVNVENAKISTGGPVSNTGINMKTLGNEVCFCACTGDDILGRLTVDLLKDSGNADGIKVLQGQASSYTVVVAPPGIDRIFLHNPGTNDHFGPENLNPKLIQQCRHFHLGYPPLMARMFADEGKELAEIFKIAKEAGATTSCDMTLPDPSSPSGTAPWRKILENILPYIDIHVPSIEETFYMLYPEEFLKMKAEHNNAELIDYITPDQYSTIADEILSMGAKMTTLKSGHRGFYIKTASKDKFETLGAAKPADAENWADRELWAQAYVVDSFGSATGSGDSSIAGLLTAYLNGLTIEEALKYATCLGYQNVRVLDAVSGCKDWNDTTEMIASGMPMIDAKMDNSGWKYHDDYKLWSAAKDKLSKG
ncbi:MAG: carbohydrate kinase family protein [Planctomycetes bacterium]|nr:carbohydrate kinase family protein [Planctomycetota bacterium]